MKYKHLYTGLIVEPVDEMSAASFQSSNEWVLFDELSLVCTVCGESFKTKRAFTVHMKSHDGEGGDQ